jgi:SAM-dependent methyltransferase
VLEVGAGAGALAAALRDDGYEVVAIDPASESPDVRAVALGELDEPAASFDAALAVVSLHHVEPLADSCRRLAELVRPGGRLVVDEFDVERLDERTAAWWLERRETDRHERRAPADVVADLRDHIHPVGRVCAALEQWFELDEPVRSSYLHRWDMPPGMQAVEEELIAAGALPATGVRFLGTRR